MPNKRIIITIVQVRVDSIPFVHCIAFACLLTRTLERIEPAKQENRKSVQKKGKNKNEKEETRTSNRIRIKMLYEIPVWIVYDRRGWRQHLFVTSLRCTTVHVLGLSHSVCVCSTELHFASSSLRHERLSFSMRYLVAIVCRLWILVQQHLSYKLRSAYSMAVLYSGWLAECVYLVYVGWSCCRFGFKQVFRKST